MDKKFYSYPGKPIDMKPDLQQVFHYYRLKENSLVFLQSILRPERFQFLKSNIEYLGSRQLEMLQSQEVENLHSFFSSEFPINWLKDEYREIPFSHEDIIENPSNFLALSNLPVLAKSLKGFDNAAALLVSPKCFEPDPDAPEMARYQ